LKRIFAAIAATVLLSSLLAGCSASGVQTGSILNIGLTDDFNSLNADNVTDEAAIDVNREIANLINPSFYFSDSAGELVANSEFGTVEVLSESPLKVRYALSGRAKWSDGVGVSARDLMLSWLAARNPADAGFNSIRSGSGLKFATSTPKISADGLSLDVTFDRAVADYKTVLTVSAAAHLVAGKAFNETENSAALARFDQAVNSQNVSDQKLISEQYSQLYLTHGSLFEGAKVSAGAYRVESFAPSTSLTLKVNRDFAWGPTTKIETLNIRFYSDATAMLAALQEGLLDLAAPQESGIASNSDLIGLAKIAGANYEFAASNSIEAVLLNFSEGSAFADSNSENAAVLREAFLALIPRAKILTSLSVDNPVIEARSWIYSSSSNYYSPFVQSNGSAGFLVQDAEKAQQLLEAADLRKPQDIRVLFDSNNPRAKAEWYLLAEYAAVAGFNLIDVSSSEPRTVFATGGFDAYITTVELAGELNGDPYWFTGGSIGKFTSPKIESLLAQFSAETKPLEQISVLKDIDAELYASRFGMPLYQVPSLLIYSDRLATVVKAPQGSSATYGYWNWSISGN
jgi:peptide/nickel transport system substrate-binding protein